MFSRESADKSPQWAVLVGVITSGSTASRSWFESFARACRDKGMLICGVEFEGALRAGRPPIVLDHVVTIPGPYAREVSSESLGHVARALRRARVDDIGLVTAIRENYQLLSAQIGAELGARSNSVDVVKTIQDKPACREALRSAGILQPQSYRVVARANGGNVLVSEDGDDVSAQEIHSTSGWILKPATGMGSAGVRYLSSTAEVIDALAASEAEGYCAEEFVTGEEFSVEGITVDGVVRVYGVTTKAKNTGFVEIGHRFPAHHPQLPGDEEISRQLQRCVDVLAIEWGHLHVEFWVRDDGCLVWGEFHVRQAGGLIAPDMIEAARPGLSIYDELIDSLSGRSLPALPQKKAYAAVDFIESKPGRVMMAGVNSSLPPASSVHWEYGVGEYAPPVNGLRANIAVIFAGADTVEHAEQILRSARQACSFAVDSVEDIA
ncbi:ATP-grasp domain-containing protein [Microbacterium sp. PI-1]|uniref:ATP-grasp domain-containing protein n=1 Tax=Microbacterium sp. PI-1 TaxID=2545631 RepID=UPI0014048E85|nr:ATP-grasp domain-containing protein [Microbacterium sp. PI-1]